MTSKATTAAVSSSAFPDSAAQAFKNAFASAPPPLTYMISGHIDLSWQLFLQKYGEYLERAIHGKLPKTFVPVLPVDPNQNDVSSPAAAAVASLPPFDLAKAAPFLVQKPQQTAAAKTNNNNDDDSQKQSQQQQQPHPIWLQNPSSTVQHTITSAINSIPKFEITSALSQLNTSKEEELAAFQIPKFVMGDADGTDFFAQVYLLGRIGPDNLTIYHRGSSPRAIANKNLKKIGNFNDHTKKDAAMTKASDVDICWVRSVDEQRILYGEKFRYRVSGTEKNVIRRRDWSLKDTNGGGGGGGDAQYDFKKYNNENSNGSNNNKSSGKKKNRVQ